MDQAPGTAPQQELFASTMRRLARRLSPPVAALAVFAVGLAVTLLAYALTSGYVEKQARQRFDAHAASAFSQVGKQLDDYRNIILGLQSAFIASDFVDRGEFHRYCENLQLKQRFPGLQALSFQRYVRHADRAAFIAAVRRDRSLQPQGYPEFAIRPPGERPDYLVIDYIEPMQANIAAFGYDVLTQPAQVDAIRLARDSGQFQVSPPFVVAQSPGGTPRLVLRAPVYRSGSRTQDVEQRRAALRGFVILTLEPQASFRESFGSLAIEGERIAIEDAGLAGPVATSQRQLIFDSSDEPRQADPLYAQSVSLEFGGRNWDIRFIADKDAWLPRQPGQNLPALVFGAGLVISLLLAALTLSQARARDEALRLAEGMTAELRRTAERLGAASELSSEWYWEQDTEFRFTDFLGKAHQAAGLNFERVKGKTRWESSPAALSPEEWAGHRRILEAHQPFTITYRFLGNDGTEHWIEIKGMPRFDQNGVFAGYHGTGRDVTERVRTFAALKKQAVVLQTTLDHMNQGISVIDRDLRVIGYNQRFIELLGFPTDLIHEDTNFEDVVRYNAGRGEYGPGDIEQQVRSRLELARRFLPHRFKRARPDGSVIEILGTPLPGGGMVTTYTDVTEQERFAEQLREERDFRQRMIDSVPGVFYLLDISGRFLLWNKKFESTVGYTTEEMHGAQALDFFEGSDADLIRERIASVFEQGEAIAEALFRMKDGSKRPYLFTGLRVEVDGKPALVGIGIDISERKRAEEALQRQSAVLQTTLDNLEQGISVIDADLRMAAMNRRFCELLDIPEDMIRGGISFEDIFRYNARRGEYGPGDIEQMVRERVALARRFEPHHFKRVRPNGRIIEVRGNPIAGGGFVTSYTDITEREHAEVALRLSEQRYRTLIDLSPDAIFVHRGHQILIANDAALKLWGVDSIDQAIGRNLLDFVHPDSRDLVRQRIAALETDPALFRLPWTEQEYQRPDGSVVPVEGSATHIELEDGPAILSVIRDISIRKQAIAALRKERDFRQKMIESVPGVFYLFDAKGRFLLWNNNLEKMLGLAADEVAQMRTIELFDSADRELVRAMTRQVLESGAATVEAMLVTKTGARVPHYISGLRIDLDGDPVVIGVGLDISERRHAEQVIRDLNETLEQRVRERTAELEASNQELESFSYSVSHDLRAPLRALHGFSHLLTEEYAGCIDANGQHYLARIRAASQRMGDLIDNLLDLARVSRQELKRAQIDLSAMAEEALAELREQQPQRTVSWSVAPNLSAQADPVLIKALLDNLLRNAWKFTAEKKDAHIEFFAGMVDGRQAFCIRDNGAGFEMAYADKLFKPFQRLHNVKRFEGTGIGLAIVQRIVRRHGGRVWAESEPGQGAAFWFTLS
jgi:PAS domain S-box-containing protein